MQDVVYDIQSDFFQYIAVKHALMSGGINHIDTGYNFRNQQSDRVVGQVLRTLINKYGYDREQFFISLKLGYAANDEEEQCHREIEIEEVINRSNGKLKPRDFLVDMDIFAGGEVDDEKKEIKMQRLPVYSCNPVWLEHQIDKSLYKMNLETLDTVILADPLENMMRLHADQKQVQQTFQDAINFLEEMVQEGKIKSYGVSSKDAYTFDHFILGIQNGSPICEIAIP